VPRSVIWNRFLASLFLRYFLHVRNHSRSGRTGNVVTERTLNKTLAQNAATGFYLPATRAHYTQLMPGQGVNGYDLATPRHFNRSRSTPREKNADERLEAMVLDLYSVKANSRSSLSTRSLALSTYTGAERGLLLQSTRAALPPRTGAHIPRVFCYARRREPLPAGDRIRIHGWEWEAVEPLLFTTFSI